MATAAPKQGVTVLVHGFTFLDDGISPYEYWGGDRGTNFVALLKRFGSGRVVQYNPDTGNYQNITGSIPGADDYYDPLGHQILLFDWRAGSNEPESGQAEAAADALFASLMEFLVDGKRIISLSPYSVERLLHFIGHSRGTVVVSETVQRLGRYNIRASYVTYLDVHDFGQPGIANDEHFHDPAVQVWENIDYADAFFQTNSAFMCGVNPSGRELEHIPIGALQRNLTDETRLGPSETYGCNEFGRPHAWIKDYYWGTVATNGGSHGRPVSWYGGGNGANYGFDRWMNRGGFDGEPARGLTKTRCVVGTDAIQYYWNNNLAQDNDFPDRNDVPPILFNGDFDLPELDRGIGGGINEANSLAGWFYFGGGGSALVRPLGQPDDSHLSLFDDALQARHNRFFLPRETRELLFALAIDHVPNIGTHQLEIRIGTNVVRRFTMTNDTGGFVVYRVEEHMLAGLLGAVNTLAFELITIPSPITLRTAEVRIDNINFVTDPTSWIQTIFLLNASNWRLTWRSWPAATFHLKSSSNLMQWMPVADSGIAGNAGSFTVPQSAAQQVYFQGEVVPAR